MKSLEESFSYCEQLTKSHYENFPVGSFLIPKDKRKYVWAVYAFARTADDFADEGRYASETQSDLDRRLKQLDDWENNLNQCVNGLTDHPVFIALSETIRKLEIPSQLLKDLLTAYRIDVCQNRYRDFDEVFHYCKHSANPVGRLVLLIFGYREESLHRLSDKICTALQLANFWQDISVDFAKNRIYLPQDQMRRFGVTEEDLRAGNCNDAFRFLLESCVQQTAALFNEGLPLCDSVGKDLKWEMRLTWLGGTTILRKIVQTRYDVFNHRPMITAGDKLTLLLKSFFPNFLTPLTL